MNTSVAAKEKTSEEAAGTESKTQQTAPRSSAKPAPRRSASSRGKSADAFRTISEVADELGVQQHVLRFWETKFPQIKPLKRGGGRRYYRPENIELLKKIHDLLYVQGYTIKGVQRLLRQNRGTLPDDAVTTEAAPTEETQETAEAPQAKPATPAKPQADMFSSSTRYRAELQSILRELKDSRQLLSDRGF